MFANSVFITGCNRGIGLALTKELIDKTEHLFVTCRNPNEATELQEIAHAHKNVVVLKLDVTKEEDIAAAVSAVEAIVGDNGLNCLINNAARMNPPDTIDTMSANNFTTIYESNVIGPAMIVKGFLPLLRKASCLSVDDGMSVRRAAILNISSLLASIADNGRGGMYSYRMSKVALNMLTKNLSIDLKKDKILAVSIDPGWVSTDMGGSNAHITPQTCALALIKVASGLTNGDSGNFVSWKNGECHPW